MRNLEASTFKKIAVNAGLIGLALLPAVACDTGPKQPTTEPTPISTPEPSTPTPGYKLPIASELNVATHSDPLTIYANVKCTLGQKRRIDNAIWNFGDGYSSTIHASDGAYYALHDSDESMTALGTISHTFKKAGTYTIAAQCVDTEGKTSPPVSTSINITENIPLPSPLSGRDKFVHEGSKFLHDFYEPFLPELTGYGKFIRNRTLFGRIIQYSQYKLRKGGEK